MTYSAPIGVLAPHRTSVSEDCRVFGGLEGTFKRSVVGVPTSGVILDAESLRVAEGRRVSEIRLIAREMLEVEADR